MSKICNRNYSEDLLLSVKMVDGVATCPSCGKPTVCHNQSIDKRALYWALSGDTGISSEAIANHMTGNTKAGRFGFQPPSDAADRARCIRLLELIPEWIPQLKEMVRYDQKKPEGIVINSSGISAYENSWSKQIPLILQEGKL